MSALDRFITVNSVRLRCREWGNPASPAVVLLHGGSAHAHWWDFFAPAIADAYHAFAFDLRGHGGSQHVRPPAYRIEDYVRDLAELIAAEALGQVALVGHSLGGLIATAYAGSAPEKTWGLVVVDSSLRITTAGARYLARLQRFPHPVYPSREEALRRFRLLPTQTTAEASILEHVAACGVRQLPDARWTLKFDRETMVHNAPQDLTPHLPRLRCPVLFVRGAHSTLLTRPGLAALLGSVPHARAIDIPGAHHHVMLDNPIAFGRAVRAFLDRASERNSRAAGLQTQRARPTA